MKIKAYITLMLATLLMTACSHIDEDEQLIYVKPAPVSRCILLEDFTGQRCVNCPTAAEEIEKLIEQYGEETIIAVSIHSGPLGLRPPVGLMTNVGNDYYNFWNLEFQPVGLIDRGAPAEYTAWGALVREELQKTAPVEIELAACVNDSLQLSIHTSVKGVDGGTNGHIQGKLQLWIVEDNITAVQMMPDGTRNNNYTHRHVFRDTINGQWGEDISVEEGFTIEREHSFTIDSEWIPDNLSVVAFVYNDSGVMQVTKTKLFKDAVEE